RSPFRDTDLRGHEEGREAHARAERLDHERRRDRDVDAEKAEDQPRLAGAREPSEQVACDGEREAAWSPAVERHESAVDVARSVAEPRRGGAEPGKEALDTTDRTGQLHRDEA